MELSGSTQLVAHVGQELPTCTWKVSASSAAFSSNARRACSTSVFFALRLRCLLGKLMRLLLQCSLVCCIFFARRVLLILSSNSGGGLHEQPLRAASSPRVVFAATTPIDPRVELVQKGQIDVGELAQRGELDHAALGFAYRTRRGTRECWRAAPRPARIRSG